MMSISSLLSDPPTNINSKPFIRTPSSPSPFVRSQKVIQTIRPILSPINSNHSPMSTSPNLSESSNDEQGGNINQTISNFLQPIDNSRNQNNKIYQKLNFQSFETIKIHQSNDLSPYSSSPQLYQNQVDIIPPLLNKNNETNHDSTKLPIQNNFDMKIPDPVFYENDGTKYGIRCVCGDPHDDGFLVQCEKCEMWLHGSCLNYARNVWGEHFYCPFCLKKKIQCVCGKNMLYDVPLIKCQNCGNWSHKSCEGIEFGIIPSNFICANCRKLENPKSINEKVYYEIPYVKFSEKDNDVIDLTIFTTDSPKPSETGEIKDKKLDIISSIPDGLFQQMIIEDLNLSEINFRSFMEKYFHTFAPLFFDRIHEFFRVFNETVCSIFNISKNSVLHALDVLANRLIYNQTPIQYNIESNNNNKSSEDIEEIEEEEKTNDIEHSESINEYLEELQVPRLEKSPISIELYTDPQKAPMISSGITSKKSRKKQKTDNDDNKPTNIILNDSNSDENNKEGVFTPVSLDDASFITEIPGFLVHSDEIKADDGIPYSSIALTNDELFIDTSRTPFQQFATRFRRSFHFNCITKIIRIKGDLRVALFATRLQGPLSEEKTRRVDAILANSELILPLDGDIPFPTTKVEWKARKKRKFNLGFKPNFTKVIDETINTNKIDSSEISSSLDNSNTKKFTTNNSLDLFNDSNDNTYKEATRKQKKKITQQTVAKRCTVNPNLTLLSTFMDESVPPMPFIILSDQEDIDTYKIQMERINDRILSQ